MFTYDGSNLRLFELLNWGILAQLNGAGWLYRHTSGYGKDTSTAEGFFFSILVCR